MDAGIIFDAALIPFFRSRMQPVTFSKAIAFTMRLHDFTIQKNMSFDDFHDLFATYFGIDFL